MDRAARDERLRDAVVAAGWDAVLATVAGAHGLTVPPSGAVEDPALDPWRDPAAAARLGTVHEALLGESVDRVGRGSFYTPPDLVDRLLDHALDGLPPGGTLLDPTCGTGNVLVAALRRLGPDAVDRVHGTDLDPVAVAITRLLLRLEAPGVDPAVLERTVRVADGLGAHPAAPYDAVVGNPPFGGRLRPRGRVAPGDAVAERSPAAYTDPSAVFLARALELVRPGGVVALVQPVSVLAARDAGPVRAAVRAAGAVTDFWSSARPVFAGTPVLTCVPVVRVGAVQGPVRVAGREVALPEGEWGPLHAPALGVPVVAPRTVGVLGDLATCAADFRDQYYGLVPHVHDGGAGAPLVTAGLVDPARNRWGEEPTRFAKRDWRRPTVDLDSLAADPRLAAWARARLVPKVLVAPQGRVVEAVVDVDGRWLPSVPVVTVAADPDRLWHVLAVLLAPPVVAGAAARYAGAGLSAAAVKLSARQVAALPLPAGRAAWDAGAALARAAQEADDAARPDLLAALGEQMCTAYDDHAALDWWEMRVRRPRAVTKNSRRDNTPLTGPTCGPGV
ncbi:HsdM family class I SAM-dependent methyltransferase [Nocardioides litoris]|uniref:HsdM family class I SAM-dependent methyltransferase n=1 Tax=Nocardioides litoris TaxID=1926648 RepID=UPI0014771601|nr:N-6 DNA methylase [Nocardioides litoris]